MNALRSSGSALVAPTPHDDALWSSGAVLKLATKYESDMEKFLTLSALLGKRHTPGRGLGGAPR